MLCWAGKIISVACTIICLRALLRLFDIHITRIITHTHARTRTLNLSKWEVMSWGGLMCRSEALCWWSCCYPFNAKKHKDWQFHLELAQNMNKRNKVSFEYDMWQTVPSKPLLPVVGFLQAASCLDTIADLEMQLETTPDGPASVPPRRVIITLVWVL